MLTTILAHGALGPWDEVIYISVAAIFGGFMLVSWFRSRNEPPDEEVEARSTPAADQPGSDHFTLD